MDRKKLTNVYAATLREPSEKEVEWVIQNVDVKENLYVPDQYKFLGNVAYQECGIDCGCGEDVEVFAIYMKDDDEINDPLTYYLLGNGDLRLMFCRKCECWALCD